MTRRTHTHPTDELALMFPGASAPVVFDMTGLQGASVSDTPQRYGAVGDGSTDDSAAFASFIAGSPATKIIPAKTYKLNTQLVPASRVLDLAIDPAALFTGTASPSIVDWSSVIPFQVGPVWVSDIKAREYGSTFATYGNVFAHVLQAKNNGVGKPMVAAFLHGIDAFGSGSGGAWGANIVGSTNVNNATIFALEVNIVQGTNAGYVYNAGYGILVASSGFAEPTALLCLQANNSTSKADKAIWFHHRTGTAAAKTYLIFSDANPDYLIPAGIDFRATTFNIDIGTKNFQVTGGNAVNFLSLIGGLSGSNSVLLKADSLGSGVGDTDVTLNYDTKGAGTHNFKTGGVLQLAIGNVAGTNALQAQAGNGFGLIKTIGSGDPSVIIHGGGAGGVVLQDGGAATKFAINTTGIGFNGATPIAKPTITGSRSGNAGLASLLTALALRGDLTDSTTA